MSKKVSFREAQDAVDGWIKKYGVRYFSELTNMALLTEEVGEVARIVSRTYGEQSFKKKDKDKVLSEELADVLFVLICLANQTGTDLTEAFEKSMVKKTLRDKKRHIGNSKLKALSPAGVLKKKTP
jgi:NTP pyrophosphatase (non-canonical NTP hydrolase)